MECSCCTQVKWTVEVHQTRSDYQRWGVWAGIFPLMECLLSNQKLINSLTGSTCCVISDIPPVMVIMTGMELVMDLWKNWPIWVRQSPGDGMVVLTAFMSFSSLLLLCSTVLNSLLLSGLLECSEGLVPLPADSREHHTSPYFLIFGSSLRCLMKPRHAFRTRR